jgi:hypothetical protein
MMRGVNLSQDHAAIVEAESPKKTRPVIIVI